VFIAAICPNTRAQGNSIAPKVNGNLHEENDRRERFSVDFGFFLTNYNSGISIGSEQLGLGIHIDIEDVLGLKTTTFALHGNANYRFGENKKHTVSIGYFGIYRNAFKVLESELVIGDNVFPIGTEISTNFNLSILRAKYDYSFLQNDHVSLGASVGFFIMPIGFSIKASGPGEQTTDFVAPLPVLGLRSDFLLSKKLYLHQSVELFFISVDNFQGRILDLDINVEHKTFKHFSFGAGINSNRLNIKVDNVGNPNINFFGEIGLEYSGVYSFAKYRF